MPEDFVKVAQITDIGAGETKPVKVGDEEILLANVDGTYYATSDICTHAYAALSEGDLIGDEVECFLHGSRFSVKTGEPSGPPAYETLTLFQVRVEGDDIFVGPPKP